MKSLMMLCLCVVFAFTPEAQAQEGPAKIAIIKADDIKKVSANWDRFFALSKSKGVKVSAGIVCNSLQPARTDYAAWLRAHAESGCIEFWNHGWDHKRWQGEGGKTFYEFQSSGYDHQKKHFSDSQRLMAELFGKAPVAFGPPYNKIDADTVKVMNEDEHVALYFGYKAVSGLDRAAFARIRLRGEHDGTGRPNFQAFVTAYGEPKNKGVTFSAIQFHPGKFEEEHFEAYAKILDFLIDEGWRFMLPAEYLAYRARS